MRGFPRIKWILGIFMGLLWRFSPLKDCFNSALVRVHTTVFGVHHLFNIVPVDMGYCQIFSESTLNRGQLGPSCSSVFSLL